MRYRFLFWMALALALTLTCPAVAQPPGGPGMDVGPGGPGHGPGGGSYPGPPDQAGRSAPPAPPDAAVEACRGKREGDACRLRGPGQGQCVALRGTMSSPGLIACVPLDRVQSQGERYPDPGERTEFLVRNPMPSENGVPDTGQDFCFNDRDVTPCPEPGEPLYGQDAQYDGPGPSYRDNGDGTATDLITGLVWETAHHAQRLSYNQAQAACRGLVLGGHDDWRLPSVKELYSLILFDGRTGGKPYLYDRLFHIAPPDASYLSRDPQQSHFPDMMGQTWTSTLYRGDLWDRPSRAAFFVNFLDGRIKCAPTEGPQELFYRCVRGPAWGRNDFLDNGDGTVTDRAMGLMWQQEDNGRGVEWPRALDYCRNLELGGRDDWRLPNVKELETLVDYDRPQPAIDTRFFGVTDPAAWFWSSTTFGDNLTDACYVCFGKGVSVDGVDVHGAGCQRSDPKTMDQKREEFRGGQRDEIRVLNYARCVRDLVE